MPADMDAALALLCFTQARARLLMHCTTLNNFPLMWWGKRDARKKNVVDKGLKRIMVFMIETTTYKNLPENSENVRRSKGQKRLVGNACTLHSR